MRTAFLIAATTFAAVGPAQDWFIPDNVATAGTCNVIPFGQPQAGSFYQSRYQCKATVADLGGVPGVITGLGFAPCISGTCTYTNLEIVIDHHPAGTSLSSTFAANLGPTAVTVLDAPNYAWNVTGNAWNEIGLQDLFVYNGVDDLVIQVTTVDGIGTGGFHRDTRQRLYWISSSGTPAPTGALGNAALKFEVSMLTAKLSSHGESCPGSNGLPVHTLTGTGQIGTTVGIDIQSGVPNLVALAVFGFYNGSPPFPLDLSGLGLPGCFQYIDSVAVTTVALDLIGSGSIALVIPNDPGLVNVRIYSQFVCIDPLTTGGATTTNYGRIQIGN